MWPHVITVVSRTVISVITHSSQRVRHFHALSRGTLLPKFSSRKKTNNCNIFCHIYLSDCPIKYNLPPLSLSLELKTCLLQWYWKLSFITFQKGMNRRGNTIEKWNINFLLFHNHRHLSWAAWTCAQSPFHVQVNEAYKQTYERYAHTVQLLLGSPSRKRN